MNLIIVVDPITSKIITSLALAERLRDEGHQVDVFVPPGQLDDVALAAFGLEVNVADLRIDPPDRPGPRPEAVARYQQQLAGEEADLYLIDIEAHEYVLAAVAADLPVLLVSLFFNLWKRPGVPPVHQDVVPGRGWRGSKPGIAYGWFGYRVFRAKDIARSLVLRNDRRYQLRAFAKDLGIDPTTALAEWHGMIPFQYRELPTLTLNLPELELPGAIHQLNHYVGPMPNLSSVGMVETDGDVVLAEIEALRASAPDRKLIYAAFGAYYSGDDLGFWKRAVKAIGQRPDCFGVFGLGGRINPDDLGPLPDNVLVYRWAPQLRILEQADCAVIHAGMTSVYECIHHKVPMVVFPLGDSFDQFGTAARVAYHQLGTVGDRNTATVEDIQSLIDQVMADQGLPARLRTFNEAMSRYESERSVTAAIRSVVD